MSRNDSPIGFFDSGIGGTSIWKEVIELLPDENTVYFADSSNAPYGIRTAEEIIELSKRNTEFLLNKNAKIIVVACNTATTNAIRVLRETYAVPFIGIEPAIKPAGLVTKTNKIGILATKGTLNSRLFEKTSGTLKPEIQILEQVGHGLVELIEAGKMYSKEMTNLLTKYLEPMIKQDIDALVLGCTHYPYLIPQIQNIVGPKIQIIDSGLAVAKQTKNVLEKNQKLCNTVRQKSNHFLYTNGNSEILKDLIGNCSSCSIRRIDP